MGYCPRCGENTNLGTGPNIVAERRQALRIPATTAIVDPASWANGDTIQYAGTRFKITREEDQILLWAVE